MPMDSGDDFDCCKEMEMSFKVELSVIERYDHREGVSRTTACHRVLTSEKTLGYEISCPPSASAAEHIN